MSHGRRRSHRIMIRTFLLIGLLIAASIANAQPAAIRLSLADAIARGFANSHRLAEARAREEGAKAAAHSADLGDKPTFNANAGYSRTNHVLNFGFPRPDGALVIVFPDIPDNFTTGAIQQARLPIIRVIVAQDVLQIIRVAGQVNGLRPEI